MGKNRIKHCITLTKSEEEWLNEHPECSLSKICQDAIEQIRVANQILPTTIKEEIRKRENFQKLVSEMCEFMKRTGTIDLWLKEHGYKDDEAVGGELK